MKTLLIIMCVIRCIYTVFGRYNWKSFTPKQDVLNWLVTLLYFALYFVVTMLWKKQ